jgi:PAS domain S-box-containing protein
MIVRATDRKMTGDFWAATQVAGRPFDSPNWALLAEEAAGLGYWRLDVATRAIAWSDGLFRLYGLEVGDLPDLETAMAAIHPEDSERANGLLDRAMKFGEDYTDQVRLKTADGSWRVMMNRTLCRRDANGAVNTVIGVVMDVTEMELANAALRASEARFRLLAENGNDLIVQLDLDGRITYISPSVETVTGYSPEALVGRDVAEIIHADDLPALDHSVEQSLAHPERRASCVEYRIRHVDGRELWLEARPTPLFDPASGEAIGITDVVRDITERKALEAELVAKCEEAQAATRAKAEFLANMSHEIRTPLTAIMGFSGLLERLPDLSGEARSHLRRICTAGDQLLGVVNDVLDFSRLDAGQVELDPQPLDPAAFVVETLDLLSGQAADKSLELTTRIADGIPAWVRLDGGRIRQVLLNLIGNAIKFTASGTVSVSLETCGPEALKFAVTDTGPGIAPELHGRLFERFSQVDGSITRDFGGAGLGLAICKRLVELMDGSIGVESATGEGSRFWFTVPAPLASAPSRGREAPATPLAAPMSILVVDDLAVNRLLVRAMLEPLGHSLEEAASGPEAVKAAMSGPFDLILMDLQMPGMDGLEATRVIRSTAEPNRTAPIVALSANVLAEQIADCHAAGMNDHLAKPIVPADLLAILHKWAEAPALPSVAA